MGMPLAVILGRWRASPAMSEVGWATNFPMLRARLLLSITDDLREPREDGGE